MGLSAGAVPGRVDAATKAGLLDLLDHAVEVGGWSRRRGCRLLDLDEDRATAWHRRRTEHGDAGLVDQAPGGGAIHGLLDYEREAILELFEGWADVDRSHRKLAHRGSRLSLVHVSESTVRRVLAGHGLIVPSPAPREPAERKAWPDWLEWKPNRIYAYDFTHFTRAKRAVVAILDMVSRKWIATVVSVEETSTQVEVCFLAALESEGLIDVVDARQSEQLRAALLSGQPEKIEQAITEGQVPLLLAVSDNGPQMRSHSHAGVPRRGPHRPALRSPSHPDRPGVDRDPLRSRQGRVATPGEDRRSRRARGRARARPPAVQRRPPARLDRLRDPRRRARRPR